jgi:uncharacterized integral membrane protein
MKYKLLIGIVLLIPVLMFVQMNIGEVPVRFLEWERMVPLSLLLTGTLLVGIVLGMMFSFVRRRKKNKKLKQAELQKQKATEEAASQPAADEPAVAMGSSETPVEPAPAGIGTLKED